MSTMLCSSLASQVPTLGCRHLWIWSPLRQRHSLPFQSVAKSDTRRGLLRPLPDHAPEFATAEPPSSKPCRTGDSTAAGSVKRVLNAEEAFTLSTQMFGAHPSKVRTAIVRNTDITTCTVESVGESETARSLRSMAEDQISFPREAGGVDDTEGLEAKSREEELPERRTRLMPFYDEHEVLCVNFAMVPDASLLHTFKQFGHVVNLTRWSKGLAHVHFTKEDVPGDVLRRVLRAADEAPLIVEGQKLVVEPALNWYRRTLHEDVVVVGNLGADILVDRPLRALLAPFGPIEFIVRRSYINEGRERRAFVRLRDKTAAKNLLDLSQSRPLSLNGRRLYFTQDSASIFNSPFPALYVRNLPDYASHRHLLELFKPFGNVMSASVVARDGVKAGFVAFRGVRIAAKVVKAHEMEPITLHGRTLRLTLAQPPLQIMQK